MLPGLLAVAGGAYAQDANEEAAKRQAEQFVASLHWKEGEIAVPKADAKFTLGSQFRYLEASDAQKVLEQLWGNPPDDSVLGMPLLFWPKKHRSTPWFLKALLIATFGLTIWQARWAYFFVMIFGMTLPELLLLLRKPIFAAAIFIIALFPIARSCQHRLFRNIQERFRLLQGEGIQASGITGGENQNIHQGRIVNGDERRAGKWSAAKCRRVQLPV